MTVIRIHSGTDQYNIHKDETSFNLKAGSKIAVSGDDHGIFFGSGTSADRLYIEGKVTQTGDAFGAISVNGANNVIRIRASGVVKGDDAAIAFSGGDEGVINKGKIVSTNASPGAGFGISSESRDTDVYNYNTITAVGTAISALDGDVAVFNWHHGTIKGRDGIVFGNGNAVIGLGHHSLIDTTAGGIVSDGDDPSSLVLFRNRGGVLDGHQGFAIDTGDSQDEIANRGVMHGQIQLGGNDDRFDNLSGSVDNPIQGGDGDDTLITGKADDMLKEDAGAGFDTVMSRVSYTLSDNVEQLILLGTNNIVGTGNTGSNTLRGNFGDNTLTGVDGEGFDTFVFKPGFGHDTIADFDTGVDKIDVSHLHGHGMNAINDIDDVVSHAQDVGSDVHISDGSDELIIKDLQKNQLVAGDFIFHGG